ncbi:cytochrome P450 [Mycena maculata]|uniref:Cytochrome P450 n=1 Tax=Mycena maculata TaxID=230809 RepID=A0AAD7K7M6_9AGAR|nr:cytochrome P450 [Mycena maculata]
MYLQFLEPHTWVKKQLASFSRLNTIRLLHFAQAADTAVPPFTSMLLQPPDGPPPDAEEESIILWAAGTLYAAGAHTVGIQTGTSSPRGTFFFAMMMYPAVQRGTQEEADAFLARENHLPTLHDQVMFPYLGCVTKVVLRWAPPMPIGLFHCTAQADTYKEFFILAKTMVIANVWAIAHDAEVYPGPFVFEPERFMGDSLQADLRDCVFGLCCISSGKYWTLKSMLVKILQRHEQGRTVELEIAFTTAIVSLQSFNPMMMVNTSGTCATMRLTQCWGLGVYMNDVSSKFIRKKVHPPSDQIWPDKARQPHQLSKSDESAGTAR